MANEMKNSAQPAGKIPPAQWRATQRKPSWASKIDWSWLFWFLGFFILPSIIRIVATYPVTWVVSSYWDLGGLGGQSQIFANRMLSFADFYGRTTITIIMLVALLLVLLYLIEAKKIDVRKWGLSIGNFIPAVVLFALIWFFAYFLYIPLASAFSGANFYVGIPLPSGTNMPLPFTTYSNFGDTLQAMFMPKLLPMYAIGSNLTDPGEFNLGLGLLDFFRVWFLNAPVLLSMTFGYFFNTFKEKVGVVKDSIAWKNYGKVVTALFIAVISIPIMQALYRVVDEWLSHSVETNVTGAAVEAPKILGMASPYFFLVFIVIAIVTNVLGASSAKQNRVKNGTPAYIKWIVAIVTTIITSLVVFAGEGMIGGNGYIIVAGLCSILFVVAISWLIYDPLENSSLLGLSEASMWAPGAIIMLVVTAFLFIFTSVGLGAIFTIPVVLTFAFWLMLAIMGNYMIKWLWFDTNPEKLGDWGRSLSKWLPGAIIFIIGFFLSTANGWLTAGGIYGPFTNNFGIFITLMLCAWVYIRTENLIAAFLLYASLPWFLNFIQVQGFQTPSETGPILTGAFVLFAVLMLVESYKLWAHYITWDIEIIRKPIAIESDTETPSPAPAA